jgi:hypothetical protein
MKEVIQSVLLLYNILYRLCPFSFKKNLRKVRTVRGVGAQHRYILMMTENPPEQLNQKCAKRLEVYTEHVANKYCIQPLRSL